MLVIGLTGGIGSGKTTVAQLFSEFGVDIIDTDEIAHDLVKKGEPALQLLVDEFGSHILQEDGALNRSKLRNIIFNDEEKRIALEHILHPLIRTQTSQQLRESRLAKKAPYAMVVIPLLVDNGDWIAIDRILVVDCEDEVQIERVMQRDQQTKEQVVAVMNAQIDREERLLAADDIINNDVNPELLEQTVLDLHRKYLEMAENINYAE